MKIAILVCYNPTLVNFRLDMMREMVRRGHQVIAVGNESDGKWSRLLQPHGIEYRFVKMQRNGLNPVWDFVSFIQLVKLLRKEKPDRIFTSQAKMVLYGGLAAHFIGIRDVYPLIAGLGSVFLSGGLKERILKKILMCGYRLSVQKSPSVFFQNQDDASFFIDNKIVPSDKIVFLNGSGVNLEKFAKQPFPGTFGFLCVCRIIRDKGVLDYLSACRMVKKQHPEVRCLLVGPFDSNPSALNPGDLQPYIDDGSIEYFGEQADVRPYLAQCNVYVLPSYREGTPKSVLEAMSCGKAIITTDAPGCRETVKDGENGFLVPIKDEKAIAEKMLFLYRNPDICEHMGNASRQIAEQRFDVRLVNQVILQTMRIGNEVEDTDMHARENPVHEAELSSCNGKDEQPGRVSTFLDSLFKKLSDKLNSIIPESKFKSGFKKFCAAVGTFLNSLDEEEEPEPPPPPEKPLKESIQDFIERCRNKEKRKVMLKEFGEWSWTMFFRGTVFFFLFVLTIWGTIWALDFSENHRIKFYPPDEIVEYLTAEHETLEAAAYQMTPLLGQKDNISFDQFDTKLIETVNPIKIYADEYGIYLMTSKGWYNGEHGIFIAKDEEKMPPDINWGLIEGRIYTYAIYD